MGSRTKTCSRCGLDTRASLAYAHNWLDSGGNEHDLMRLMGWTNPKVVGRYAASTATERALRAISGWHQQTISERF